MCVRVGGVSLPHELMLQRLTLGYNDMIERTLEEPGNMVSSVGPVCLANLAPHQPLRNVKCLVQMRDFFFSFYIADFFSF